jgi:hypothetical protein
MTNRERLPDHVMPLPGEDGWAIWRTVCLRGAGFPAADVLRLADAESTAAADRLAAVETETEALRQSALEALRGELEAASKDRLDVLVKAIRKVKRSQPAATAGLAPATAAAIDAWKAAAGRLEVEKKSYETVFAEGEERLGAALREVASSERFREAVAWQNRHAAETGLASFLRRPAGEGRGTARDRGHVQMLASYIQRYSTKNDTIGFFGPVGWARLSDSGETIAARPGDDLLASREVYLEGWAIDALADKLAEDEAMRPWLAPRRSPYFRREDNVYIGPNGLRIELGPLSSALLAACDGRRPAGALMRDLGPALTPDKEAALWGLLADLHTKGLIRWSFQVPMSSYPERSLREQLLRIEEEPLRERALALLDEVVAGRDAVARAAGNAEEVERALGALEATFTRATGKPATRAGGQLYAGRTLVYEDCRRDLDVELGAPFLAELAPALSLVLASARWFTHYVAAESREQLTRMYEELSPQAGSGPLDVLTFSRVALPRLVNMHTQRAMHLELQGRWQRVLAVPEGQRRVHLRSEDLRAAVRRELYAPRPGWQKARVHSPDLMIAAPSVEAIRQGDYQVVLGEVHLAVNTLDRLLFYSQHPDPERLRAEIGADLPEPCLIPVLPKVWYADQTISSLGLPVPGVTGRMELALSSPKDYYLDFSLDAHGFPASQMLPISELVIEPGENGLVVGPRDGHVRFDIIEFYQLPMMVQALETFRIQLPGNHTPRVTIDRLIVARESWRFPAGELEFAQASTAAERFAAIRRWAGQNELPRFLFVKTPGERKPFYLDLDSPVLVEIFAKAVRRGVKEVPDGTVQLSEMVPGHGELWLPDAQGNRYTCELRTVVVDLSS